MEHVFGHIVDVLSEKMRGKIISVFTYKNYLGSIEYSEADKCWYGKILNIPDLVNYEAPTPATLLFEFEKAVDDYIKER